jgi:hypothetical protein
MKHVLSILYFGFAASTVSPAAAYFCSEPDAPGCATGYGSFDARWEFDRCKNDMERHKDVVEEHLSCLKRQSSQVIEDFNEAVESFNRRVKS